MSVLSLNQFAWSTYSLIQEAVIGKDCCEGGGVHRYPEETTGLQEESGLVPEVAAGEKAKSGPQSL